jgi:hypothetical protein
VVATLVLCTVNDPEQVLTEVERVLRPGGSFLFAEHVRSASTRAARWQDRLNRPWSWYACGCQCNRDTVSAISGASFALRELRHDRLRWISPVVRPLVVGSASPSSAICTAQGATSIDVAPSTPTERSLAAARGRSSRHEEML